VAELRGQGGVAADQLGGGEVMALGLEDVMVVDRAELADRAIDGQTKSASARGAPALSGRVKNTSATVPGRRPCWISPCSRAA
jgi:hypothetical protein